MKLELADTSSTLVIQTYSSSSSNSFPAPAPKADSKAGDDTNLWPAVLERKLILTVKGTGTAWSGAESSNRKCKEFHNKGLEHFDLLGQLFKTGTASSAQADSPDSSDDVIEIPHPDMGQGSNPKGKQPVYSNTSTGQKRKAIEAIIEMELPKKTRSETVESPSPFSVSKATKIVNSMFGGPLSNSTLLKFLHMLKNLEMREIFITLRADMRQAFIEDCCGSG
ncbi:hypothetical protein SO802_030190 [Lithocarpus litseifolius]|uniref:Uncharacterized protein n=1 Tax=Lithocarpus litseifolius TaxID=425828 RepID=A0AAW2BX35_9ROSI